MEEPLLWQLFVVKNRIIKYFICHTSKTFSNLGFRCKNGSKKQIKSLKKMDWLVYDTIYNLLDDPVYNNKYLIADKKTENKQTNKQISKYINK